MREQKHPLKRGKINQWQRLGTGNYRYIDKNDFWHICRIRKETHYYYIDDYLDDEFLQHTYTFETLEQLAKFIKKREKGKKEKQKW